MDVTVDDGLIRSVTEALQAQERLQIQLRTRRDHSSVSNKVYPEVCQVLDSLRDVKSEIEGTAVTFEPVTVQESALQELRSHVLMHIPMTLTPEVKNKMKELVIKAFGGSCKKVLYGALITCPWYCSTQSERGLQAKHNTVFVVYSNKDEQFFSPVNPHMREKDSEVIDKGWFYATEVSHFASYFLKGKVRFLEAYSLPESAVFLADQRWRSLQSHLEPNNCLMLRGFLEQCRGQAIGTVAKKSKSTGKMRLKDGATLYEFSEGFRLLQHATASLSELPLQLINIDGSMLSTDIAQEALTQLQHAYQSEQCDKRTLCDIMIRWRAMVDQMMVKRRFTAVQDIERSVGLWLMNIRTDGRDIPQPTGLSEHVKQRVQSLLDETMGGPVSAMVPENIVMIARAGSYLYGLDVAGSDVDYLIIYADPLQKVLSSCHRPVECLESRGTEKLLEYGAYEVRRFCEMLWKGSVVILELIFAEKLEYISPAWQDLVSNKQMFLTERAALQYFGLIKNNMADIRCKRYINTKRERKLFYQILHKLYCLEFFVSGECPRIRCDETARQYILRIREGPLEGDICREHLYEQCCARIDSLKERLSRRTQRLPENVNYTHLCNWLLRVRGWNAAL